MSVQSPPLHSLSWLCSVVGQITAVHPPFMFCQSKQTFQLEYGAWVVVRCSNVLYLPAALIYLRNQKSLTGSASKLVWLGTSNGVAQTRKSAQQRVVVSGQHAHGSYQSEGLSCRFRPSQVDSSSLLCAGDETVGTIRAIDSFACLRHDE